MNLVLQTCHERVFSAVRTYCHAPTRSLTVQLLLSAQDGVELVPLGLYVVRGDNVALVGLVDVTADKAIDFSTLRAAPLKPVVH
jgi:hypothetical protein